MCRACLEYSYCSLILRCTISGFQNRLRSMQKLFSLDKAVLIYCVRQDWGNLKDNNILGFHRWKESEWVFSNAVDYWAGYFGLQFQVQECKIPVLGTITIFVSGPSWKKRIKISSLFMLLTNKRKNCPGCCKKKKTNYPSLILSSKSQLHVFLLPSTALQEKANLSVPHLFCKTT